MQESLRRADARFVLPRVPRRAMVAGASADAWRASLEAAGVVVDARGEQVDLAVCDSRTLDVALAARPAAVLAEGTPARHLERHGFRARTLLTLPGLSRPELVVAFDDERALRHALARRSIDAALRHRARNRLLVVLAGSRLVQRAVPHLVVGTRGDATPALLRAAGELGVDTRAGWHLALGRGDDLQRGLMSVLAPGSTEPDWVVKFARVAGHDEPFVRDEHGLALVAGTTPAVARHAPRWLGRLELDGGIPGSVESAGRGDPLHALLARHDRSSEVLVDRIADWIVDLGLATRRAPEALAAERRRLHADVVAHAVDERVAALVDALPPLPAVVAHHDLGTWNIVAEPDDGTFTVLDWESARPDAMPLWDLVYFLGDALSHLDGAEDPPARVEQLRLLFRGDARRSTVLFRHVRRAVSDLGLPAHAVGPIVTLCWLHHARSHDHRRAAAERVGGHVEDIDESTLPPLQQLAPVWLADPLLGPGWAVWQG